MRTSEQVGLAPGARVGSYTLVAWNKDGITLKGHRGFSGGLIAFGLIVAAWGLMAVAGLLRGETVPLKALLFPVLGLICAGAGVVQWHAGYIIDRSTRSLLRTGITGSSHLHAESLDAVRILILPTNLQQRESVQVTIVRKPASEGALATEETVGIRRTTKSDAPNLIRAATHVAALLRLPLVVDGEIQHAPAAVQQALLAAREQSRNSPGAS